MTPSTPTHLWIREMGRGLVSLPRAENDFFFLLDCLAATPVRWDKNTLLLKTLRGCAVGLRWGGLSKNLMQLQMGRWISITLIYRKFSGYGFGQWSEWHETTLWSKTEDRLVVLLAADCPYSGPQTAVCFTSRPLFHRTTQGQRQSIPVLYRPGSVFDMLISASIDPASVWLVDGSLFWQHQYSNFTRQR